MNLNRPAAILLSAAVAVSTVAVAAPAQAATRRTGVVVQYFKHTVKVKPATIEPFKDLYFTGVRWTSLSRSTGRATAVSHTNTCIPACAAGNYRTARVALSFTRVRTSGGRPVFTRVKVTEGRHSATYQLPQ